MSLFRRLLRGRKQQDDAQWQTPNVQEICIAMIRLIPDTWDSAALVLEVPEKGMGTGLSHSPITPQPLKDFAVRGPDFVMPDNEVFAATRKLELGWMERKGTFKRAIITARKDEEGWQIQSEYEHE